MKKKAAEIAATFEKQGMSAEKAMKKAWQQITNDAFSGASKTKTAVSGINAAFSSLGGTVSRLGGLLTSVLGPISFIWLAKECIELGSSVSEVQNVVDTAFGSMAHKMEAFADTAITSFGMSELAAKKTGSTYMAMAKGIGIADGAASDMAITLTGLSGDVASFYNISQDLASTKLKSVFTGETETLKDLGVVMTQTNLEQYALSRGISKSISAMTQAELATLRYNFVLDSLNLASGDFVKTQDSWANQTRILSMQLQALGANIGQILTTVLLPAVKTLNEIIGNLVHATSVISAAISSLFGVQISQNSQIASTAAEAAEAENNLATGITNAAKAAKKSLAGFDELNTLQGNDGGSGGGGVGFGGVDMSVSTETSITPGESKMTEFVAKMQEQFAALKDVFAPTIAAWDDSKVHFENGANSIKTAFSTLGGYLLEEFIPNVTNSFSENLAPIFADVVSLAISEAGKHFEWFGGMVENVTNDIIMPTMKLLDEIYTDTFGAIGKAWDEHGGELVKQIELACENIRKFFTQMYERFIKPVWDKFMEVLTRVWNEGLEPLVNRISEFVMSIGTLLLQLYNEVIAPIVDWLMTYIYPIIEDVISNVLDILGDMWINICSIVDGVLDIFEGLIQFVVGVFTGDWEAAWDGICMFFEGIWDTICGIAEWAWNAIRLVFEPVAGFFTDLWTGISNWAIEAWESIKSVFSTIGNWIDNNIIQPVAGFFSGLWNGFVNGAIEAWNGIMWVFSSVGNFFAGIFNTVKDTILGVFAKGGEIFVGIGEGILSVFKTVVNAIIDGVNFVIKLPFEGLNGILGTIQGIDIVGLKPFGWLSWRAPVPRIPYLAQGAVLPPNKPFMAVVGDQKHGTNIEAPLATIQEAVALVMADQMGGMMAGFNAVTDLQERILQAIFGLDVSDSALAAAVQRHQSKMLAVTGGHP